MRLAISFACIWLASCASTSEPNEEVARDAGTDVASSADARDEAAPDGALPLAPTLTALMPMAGALHVRWISADPFCEIIEGERKSASTAYEVVFTVPGEADNEHDTTATGNVDYTYRLRCKKGSAYSPYSAEKTGNPAK